MLSMILPPPVSLVLAGINGFCGSEPFAVMIAVGSPAGLSPPPPVEHPLSTSALAIARPPAAAAIRVIRNVPPVQNVAVRTSHRSTALIPKTLRRGSTPGKPPGPNRYIVETNRHDPCAKRNDRARYLAERRFCS